jgi:aminoglycoside phosphotransferase (APT) family kinase protein
MTGAAILVPVLENHRFDEAALTAYLKERLPGFGGEVTIRQFQGGQSNPTFAIAAGDYRYVLRKKPPGKLLPSAHAVEREYAVMAALAGSAVPVPVTRLLCEDDAITGTPFYVMDLVEGRVLTDLTLAALPEAERASYHLELMRVMAALHTITPESVGLAQYGRANGYVARTIERWSKQYRASETEPVPAMDRLIAWLPQHLPEDRGGAIVHGDFRLGNMIFHPQKPEIVAVLDWELSTLGDPLAADLAYAVMPWAMPAASGGIADVPHPGVPDAATLIAAYAGHRGWRNVPDLGFYQVFTLFRFAAILAGVYRRALDGNAADARGAESGIRYRALAETGWAMAQAL